MPVSAPWRAWLASGVRRCPVFRALSTRLVATLVVPLVGSPLADAPSLSLPREPNPRSSQQGRGLVLCWVSHPRVCDVEPPIPQTGRGFCTFWLALSRASSRRLAPDYHIEPTGLLKASKRRCPNGGIGHKVYKQQQRKGMTMYRGKRKIPKRCRWIGHHRWDCGNSRSCKGNHVCLDCGAGPAFGYYSGLVMG